MAHDVTFEIPSRDLGKADVTFHVKRSGKKLGTLAVSKGSVVWFPKDHSYGYRIGWSEFDKLMIDNGVRGPEKR
ncbi:MAG: hypothetical protein DMF68_10160 [Acidobacteria bacterium]|nr:MAG: hypothetical protein DMF68_10160 [Acidobacteriota bacterium]